MSKTTVLVIRDDWQDCEIGEFAGRGLDYLLNKQTFIGDSTIRIRKPKYKTLHISLTDNPSKEQLLDIDTVEFSLIKFEDGYNNIFKLWKRTK